MNDHVRVERIANILAGTLTLFWVARGALLLIEPSRLAIDILVRDAADFARRPLAHWRYLAAPFLFLGATLAYRSGEPRVHRAQMILIGLATAAISFAAPAVWSHVVTPFPLVIAVFGLIATLGAMSKGDDDIWRAELRLRATIAIAFFFSGIAQLAVDRPADAALLARFLKEESHASKAVLFAGIGNIVCAVASILVVHSSRTLRGLLWFRVGVACVVPTLVTIVDGTYLYHPASPLLNEMVFCGALAAMLHLGQKDDVRFYGALKTADRSERLTDAVLSSRRFAAELPFSRIADENRAQISAIGGLLGDRDIWAKFDRLLIAAASTAILLRLRFASRTGRIDWTIAAESRSRSAYRLSLAALPEKSLSRRVVEDMIETKDRHIRRLADAR